MPLMDALKKSDAKTADDIATKGILRFTVPLSKSWDALANWKLERGQRAFKEAQQRFRLLRTVGLVLIVVASRHASRRRVGWFVRSRGRS